MAAASGVGRGLAKVLGIKVNANRPRDQTAPGESLYSISTADTYVEHEPTAPEWIAHHFPTGPGMLRWLASLFPFAHWITRYNAQWLYGDLVAGITVGAVVVPQSMAYAKLAKLAPEFGLYSSFMGVLIYWFFATSKDITIGPVAVMSLLVGDVVTEVKKKDPQFPPNVVASALAIICGAIIVFIGLIRMGRIVELISLSAISAFMTGSAINIAVGQVPNLMGITGFDTRDHTYRVVIHTLQHLGRSKLDAAIGLTALTMLYLIRSACNFAAKRNPNRRKTFFFIATLRTAFVILLYILISYLVNRHHRDPKKWKFALVGVVPRGFKHAAVPTVNKTIIKAFLQKLPSSVIVLLIEHIAISKSFGRINNYTIDPSQEMIAIGVTNLLGPFLGAYPATGSFSRTAIKSKAGVRTPFAGVITAIVVLLAIYALPAMFYYIPNAALSAVIIHAVGDLITPPNTLYQFWRVSPWEVLIFFVGVFVTVFSSIENGIYCTICISLGVLLFRQLIARGRFLGKVKVHSVIGDHVVGGDNPKHSAEAHGRYLDGGDPDKSLRNLFLPMSHNDGSNPQVVVEAPYPGIFIYRFSEGFNYPSANHYLDHMVGTIFAQTRRTNPHSYGRLGDRPWNDPGPRRGEIADDHSNRPTLKAIILDFSSVNNVDITSVQLLIDVRNQLDNYTAPEKVDWHFACINNRWTKRALEVGGFGYPTPIGSEAAGRWKPLFSVAEIGGSSSAAAEAQQREHEEQLRSQRIRDAEQGRYVGGDGIVVEADSSSHSGSDLAKELSTSKPYGKYGGGGGVGSSSGKVALVHGLNLPLFHIDLTSALQSAVANVEWREALALKHEKLVA